METPDNYELLKIGASSVTVVTGLFKGISFLLKRQMLLKRQKELDTYYTLDEIKKATRYFINTKCQNVPPSNYSEPSENEANAVRQDAIKFFIKKVFSNNSSVSRYYVIFADSGMGKTTFLLNLYTRYQAKKFKSLKIKLLPLAHPDIDKDIESIPEIDKSRTILLLDAFDEDLKAISNYSSRLTELIDKTRKFKRVVFTCRTQFFPNEIQEPLETGVMKYGGEKGYHTFQKFYLSPFDSGEVKKYLRKRFSIFSIIKRIRANKIIEKSPSLMVRPMLLSYIDLLVEDNNKYQFTYEIYESLINKWIEREANIKPADARNEYAKELYKFSDAIATYIYINRDISKGLIINGEAMAKFAKEHDVLLEEMDMKSRSLLNRNSEGYYKFSHKSILEYFLAKKAFTDNTFNKSFQFDGMSQAKKFYNELMFNNNINQYISLYFHESVAREYRIEVRTTIEGTNQVKSIVNPYNLVEMKKTLWSQQYLTLYDRKRFDISLLEALQNVKSIEISNQNINTINRLHIDNVEKIILSNNLINKIESMSAPKLFYLDLSFNKISNIKFIENLTSLTHLDISFNPISMTDIQLLARKLPMCKIVFRTDQKIKETEYYNIYISQNDKNNYPSL